MSLTLEEATGVLGWTPMQVLMTIKDDASFPVARLPDSSFLFIERDVMTWMSFNAGINPPRDMLTESEILENAIPVERLVGIYSLVRDKKIVCVGKSENAGSRIASHVGYKEFDSYAFLPLPRYLIKDAELLAIRTFKPEYNRAGKE